MGRSILLIPYTIFLAYGCHTWDREITMSFSLTVPEKYVYMPGDTIAWQRLEVINSSLRSLRLDSMVLDVGTADSDGENRFHRQLVKSKFAMGPGATISTPMALNMKKNLPAGGYLVHMNYWISGDSIPKRQYLTFFRIATNEIGLTYRIEKDSLGDLPIIKLEGGLSAEYMIQKSVSSLAEGVSHSWNVPQAGMGPSPIPATPDFLERSIQQTVKTYNDFFGADTRFETVVVGTGIPSTQYLARALNAPVLPIHFLVGAHTTKEVQTILDESLASGMEAYATIGHDYSLSESQAVAWIKLLSLPRAYAQFLLDHKVERVIFIGAMGKGGESGARQLGNDARHYAPGSIYLMHFAGEASEGYLKNTIRDYDARMLKPFGYIADWEAGVLELQVDTLAEEIRQQTHIDAIYLLTTNDAINLWNMGSYVILNFFRKNGLQLKGFSLNPYLIGHPFFETYQGLIPFLYWQGFDAHHHFDQRLSKVIWDAVDHFYPGTEMKELTYWVNSTNNFGGPAQAEAMSNVLLENGCTKIIENDYNVAEVWDLSDGVNSASEIRANQLLPHSPSRWNQKLKFLTVSDLQSLVDLFPELQLLIK